MTNKTEPKRQSYGRLILVKPGFNSDAQDRKVNLGNLRYRS